MHQSENKKEFLLGCRKEREWYMLKQALTRLFKWFTDMLYDFGSNTEPEGDTPVSKKNIRWMTGIPKTHSCNTPKFTAPHLSHDIFSQSSPSAKYLSFIL
jgi:hypothetical protein